MQWGTIEKKIRTQGKKLSKVEDSHLAYYAPYQMLVNAGIDGFVAFKALCILGVYPYEPIDDDFINRADYDEFLERLSAGTMNGWELMDKKIKTLLQEVQQQLLEIE